MATTRERLLTVARGQTGVRYWSMHTGPKGSGEEGWGCAMFVAWVYRQVLGTDYYGSCWNFAGDALGQSINQGGGEWRFISADEALPGDAVLYCASGHNGRDYDDYGHIALYLGDGRVIGAMGTGVPGGANYLNIGIKETSVQGQSIGGMARFVRCTRLDGESEPEVFAVNETVRFKTGTNVREEPSMKGKVVAKYKKGDTCRIDGVVMAEGYMWGRYVGASSGKPRYVFLGSHERVTVE